MAYLLDGIAANLSNTPGGFDELYSVAKKRFPEETLPHQEIFMKADPQTFGPEVKKAFLPIVKQQLIPEYIEQNKEKLKAEISKHMPDRTVEGLVDLYQRAGADDYDWKPFGPNKTEIQWAYHSFDPDDGKLWERGWRYRPVEWPKGMENWFSPNSIPRPLAGKPASRHLEALPASWSSPVAATAATVTAPHRSRPCGKRRC